MKNTSGKHQNTTQHTRADYVDSDVGSSHEYVKDNSSCVFMKTKKNIQPPKKKERYEKKVKQNRIE